MASDHSVSTTKGSAPSWLLKGLLGLGLLVDGLLVLLLLGVVETVLKGMETSVGLYAVFAWAMALAISILAPLYGFRKWRSGQRGAALAGVWLPILGLLAGAVFAI
ncbi:hypothetical protein ACT6QH_02280 [Xanthobacter sp. TB0139]|uniref:hypothetical protein n=1 Tax=Xanthobacter sp. TB0139 TaxID=3459178 RepID=UPI004039733C